MLFLRDLRYGARIFTEAPGFATAALLALALGMGATTAIFSVFDAVLLKPLPFRESSRVLVIWEKNPALNRFRMFVAPANFRSWREQAQSVESMAAVAPARVNLTSGPNGHLEPEELKAERVSASLFPLLGVQPAIGRAFREEEDQPGRINAVLLSHQLWQRRFGGDPSAVGKSVSLSNRAYTIAGVLPPGFSVLDPEVELWLPIGLDFNNPRVGPARSLAVIARPKPGVSIEQVRAELEGIGNRLEQTEPTLNKGWRPSVFPVLDELAGKVERALQVLMAAVGLLLLLACANIANLLLARGAARRKEMAIRTAMGASRGRIVTQLMIESAVLSAAGAALGILLAAGGLRLLAWLGTGSIPRLAQARVDMRLFLFALVVSAAAGFLFGIIPAIQVSGSNLNTALTESPRGGTISRTARMARSVLAALQIAVAVVVLTGSGLLIRSFLRLRAVDPGFRPQGVLTVRLPLGGGRNAAPERRIGFFRDVAERVAALPGVRSVGMINAVPLKGLGGGSEFTVEGRAPVTAEQRPVALVRFVSATYFRTMGIPLLAGREFAVTDAPPAPPAIIVNQTVARRFWPLATPVGGRIAIAANGQVAEIVGVVGDVKSERMEGEDWPTIYYPYTQASPSGMALVVRTAGRPYDLSSAIAREVHRVDADQPLAEVVSMEDVIEQAMAGAKFNTVVLGAFAAIAFVLAAVGIYGVVSYDVSQRTHEIGIRMALGAHKDDVLKLILGQGARLAAAGILVGLAAAYALTRLMASLLFGVNPADAGTFAAISLLLGAVALAASYVPSRRAASVDPLVALRYE